MSETTSSIPCADPGGVVATPVPMAIEQADPGGVSCTKRRSSLIVWSWSTLKPTYSALVVQVLKLAAALETAGNALARPAGQSSARWQVLAAVEDGPLSVASIARALAHTRQSVQRVADLLVADRLAHYVPNPAHRRAKLLELTP